MKKKILLLLLSVTTLLPSISLSSPLTIGTIERPPFMMTENDGSFNGFSVELWEEVARREKIDYRWKEFKIFKEMIDATQKSKINASIANISITSDREKILDYSQPIYDSGLQILINSSSSKTSIWEKLTNSDIILPLIIGIVVLLITTYFLWLKISPFISIIWLIFGISLISIFTIITKVETRAIDSIENLGGRKIGIMKSPVAKNYLKSYGIIPKEFELKEKLYDALKKKKIDAIVGDAPVLQYYANHDGLGNVVLSGKIFKPEKYGIIFPEESELKEKVDRALIKMQEDGSYEKLYQKYFGKK